MLIKDLVPKYLVELKILNRAPLTITNAKSCLLDMVRFLKEEKVDHIEELNADVLEEYRQDLAFRISTRGKPLGARAQQKYISSVRGFTRFLLEKDYLPSDPGRRLRYPKQPKRLPRVILENNEMKKLLNGPDMRNNRGYRNRIVLEILYDTGIRRSELSNVKISDLDLDGGYLLIRMGKGAKDRVVPLSARVCNMVQSYINAVRPLFVQGKDEGWLILNRWGNRLNPHGVGAIVKRCVLLAGIKKNVTTHTFRHSCATHMLKNGASVRHVQELLGHESLESTQVYTRVTINDLKEVHAKYHPGEMR